MRPVRAVESCVVGALVALLLSLPPAAHAQVSDTSPPVLINIDFTPNVVDVTGGSAGLTVTATMIDNLAGAGGVNVRFTSPSGLQTAPSGFNTVFLTRISGNALNGVYRGVVTIPQFAESGVWKLSVSMSDFVGNSVALTSGNLTGLGFPVDLTVSSVPDTQPPQLTALAFMPSTVNVSSGPQMVTARIGISDPSGVDLSTHFEFRVHLRSPSGQERYAIDDEFLLVSGTAQDGVWDVTFTIPQYSEDGVWSMSILRLLDRAGNSRSFFSAASLRAAGFNPDFTVVSLNEDVAPPRVTGLSFSPQVFDTSAGSQVITVSMTVQDNRAGVSFDLDFPHVSFVHGIQFRSPSGQQFRYAASPNWRLSAGTPLNGTWTSTAFFPQFSEAGTWTASLVYIRDVVNNRLDLNTAQMNAAGLPSTLTIFRPSEDVDGTVGPEGGTVDDAAFGDRASLDIPPGMLPADTDIAIDVLSSPLLVPTPRGFSAGTFFVNVDFTPTPPMPFPRPGMTLTLPFSTFVVPGTRIHLFRLDPLSGLLVPAVSVTGARVTGLVNADGLSATFSGVARFSTLVGFIETAVAGDVDGDGLVNCVDLGLVRASFGKRLGQAGFDSRADLNRNNVVDINDLAVVSRELPAGTVCN